MAEQIEMSKYMTDLALSALEQGKVPWHCPWSKDGVPMNLVTKHKFTGSNVWILAMQQMIYGYERALWVTFAQCKKLGGKVAKGSKSAVLFQPRFAKVTGVGGKDESKMVGFRAYRVFNVAQCTGLELPALPVVSTETVTAEAEAMFAAWTVETSHEGDRAFYLPSADRITLPSRERFKGASEYACTRFHEMSHSTGHVSRLDRNGITDKAMFGSHCYAEEEMIAELAASALCAMTGMDRVATVENSKAYLGGWASKIRDDDKLVSRAVSAAQKAVKLIADAVPAEQVAAA